MSEQQQYPDSYWNPQVAWLWTLLGVVVTLGITGTVIISSVTARITDRCDAPVSEEVRQ